MEAPKVRLNAWQRLVGPDATRSETVGTVVAAGLGAAFAVWRAVAVDASPLAMAVVVILALDVVGGVWANATFATKAWYHRPGVTGRSHVLFAAAHVHPFVLALLFDGFGWWQAVILYAAVLSATAVIRLGQVRLASPLAASATLFVVVGVQLAGGAWGVEWFPLAFALKLLVGHAVPPAARG